MNEYSETVMQRQMDSFPVLPATVAQILRVTGDPESSAGDLMAALLPDQSLCATVAGNTGKLSICLCITVSVYSFISPSGSPAPTARRCLSRRGRRVGKAGQICYACRQPGQPAPFFVYRGATSP